MQVCILYAGKDRDSDKLRAISESLAKGLAAQGHIPAVINMRNEETRLALYDYVIVGTEPLSLFSAKVPECIRKYLERSGASGKRSMAFISGGVRKNKALLNLMRDMESEGMMLLLSEVISKPDLAMAIGKRLNIERNI